MDPYNCSPHHRAPSPYRVPSPYHQQSPNTLIQILPPTNTDRAPSPYHQQSPNTLIQILPPTNTDRVPSPYHQQSPNTLIQVLPPTNTDRAPSPYHQQFKYVLPPFYFASAALDLILRSKSCPCKVILSTISMRRFLLTLPSHTQLPDPSRGHPYPPSRRGPSQQCKLRFRRSSSCISSADRSRLFSQESQQFWQHLSDRDREWSVVILFALVVILT